MKSLESKTCIQNERLTCFLHTQDHVEEIEASKKAVARYEAAKVAAAAKSRLQKMKRPKLEATDSGLSPAWRLVLMHLVEDISPVGLRPKLWFHDQA